MQPHFLVTAGNTRELIDDVRDWGNIFTGKTGLDLAVALLDVGDVTLLTSNTQHAAEFNNRRGTVGTLAIQTFQHHADLESAIARVLKDRPPQAVLMSAAVADYQPDGAFHIVKSEPTSEPGKELWLVERVQRGKVKSSFDRVAFTGVPTRKIIDQFRTAWRYTGFLVKFKLEVGISEEQLIAIAAASRMHSGADVIVANTLEMVRGDNPGAWVITEASMTRVPRSGLAKHIHDVVAVAIR